MFRGTRTQVATYFLVVCLLSITFLVFVNASMSFVITEILNKRERIGDDVGTLGFVDELIAIFACPIWGILSDRIGSRTVVVISYLVISLSLFLFVNTHQFFPDLVLVRILFSIGGAGATTMVTAILPSLTKTSDQASTVASEVDNSLSNVASTASNTASEVTAANTASSAAKGFLKPRESGSFRLAGFVGTAAGCGALLAVFGFLRLPPLFQERHMSGDMALSTTFYIVGVFAGLAAFLSFFGLRGIVTGSVSGKAEQSKKIPIWQMSHQALIAAYRNQDIGLAYLGGFVARASSVGISLFIPLWVNSFYIQSRRCQIDDNADVKSDCRDAYTLSSTITGVSQLTALLVAPLFGIVSERFRQSRVPVILAAIAGTASYIVLASIKDPRIRDGDIGLFIFLVAALTGLSQVGAIVCSLGLLGHTIALDRRPMQGISGASTPSVSAPVTSGHDGYHQSGDLVERSVTDPLLGEQRLSDTEIAAESNIMSGIEGSIAGMYSFAGGLGILLLTKVGGLLFDQDPAAPFWLLAAFNLLLITGAIASVIVKFCVEGKGKRVWSSIAASHRQTR